MNQNQTNANGMRMAVVLHRIPTIDIGRKTSRFKPDRYVACTCPRTCCLSGCHLMAASRNPFLMSSSLTLLVPRPDTSMPSRRYSPRKSLRPRPYPASSKASVPWRGRLPHSRSLRASRSWSAWERCLHWIRKQSSLLKELERRLRADNSPAAAVLQYASACTLTQVQSKAK